MAIITGHFTRVQTNATWTAGPPNYIPAVADWKGFDQRISQAVDGDKGGTWAPSTLITINGSGVIVTGKTAVSSGELTSETAGAWEISDPSWPLLGPTHASRSRTIVSTTLRAFPSVTSVGRNNAYPLLPNVNYGSPQTVLTPGAPIVLRVPLRVHDGSVLSTVTVNWIVSTPHSLATPPSFRVLSVTSDGTATVMSSTATGADVNGYFYPAISGQSGWYNGGLAQSMTIPVDTSNTISIATTSYFLEINEERGVAGYPWSATIYSQSCIAVATTNIPPTSNPGSQTVDGLLLLGALGYVLLTNQTDPTQNGLWLLPSGFTSWTRVPLSTSSGAIFCIRNGTLGTGTYWQMLPSSGAQNVGLWNLLTAYTSGTTVAPVNGGVGLLANCTTGGTSSTTEPAWPTTAGQTVTDGSVTWTMQVNSLPQLTISPLTDPLHLNTGCLGGFAAFGNIWLPVLCEFVDIADCRWD